MDYKDFVWFVLSEEDKGNDVSLDYWFRCIDLDDDGCLRSNEMNVSLLHKGPSQLCGRRLRVSARQAIRFETFKEASVMRTHSLKIEMGESEVLLQAGDRFR